MVGMEYRQIQEQKPVLSQKMIQSTEILQMDIQGLERYIQQQALENPLIDMEEMERGISSLSRNEGEEDLWKKDEFKRKLEWLNQADEQNRVYYSHDYEEAERQELWNISVEENDLQDYLLSQLAMQIQTEKDYECMEFLVYSLDSKGYLMEDVKELQKVLKIDDVGMEHYIGLLQASEPAGVGARSLEECMQIQLRRQHESGLLDKQTYERVNELAQFHLEALGKNHFDQIAAQMEIGKEEVIRYSDIIRNLNPIPGNSFSSREGLHYVKPDVTVVKFEDYFEILINSTGIPQVSVNRYYLNLMNDDSSEEVQQYIQNKYRQVQWIQHCIEERTSTLKKVVREIVRIQSEFFEKNEGKRIPMSLRDVAQVLDVHESTVSRAIKNKFLQCAWGVYPINYFFVRKAASDSTGEELTPELIKQKIKILIQEENPNKPLSDQKITDCLKRDKIILSRRTVAKYRAEMMIPDTTGRKSRF